jgi:hypothetical protein
MLGEAHVLLLPMWCLVHVCWVGLHVVGANVVGACVACASGVGACTVLLMDYLHVVPVCGVHVYFGCMNACICWAPVQWCTCALCSSVAGQMWNMHKLSMHGGGVL